MDRCLVTKARWWAGECRRLARAALKLIYRKMEVLSEGALAATKSPIGDSQDAMRQAELVRPSATDVDESGSRVVVEERSFDFIYISFLS